MSLYIAGALMLLVGLACTAGAWALRKGAPTNWPDVVGSSTALRRTALGLAVVGVSLIVSGIGTIAGLSSARYAGAVATIAFALGGFWGNYAVFGDLRPKHTVTNVVVAAAILVMLLV